MSDQNEMRAEFEAWAVGDGPWMPHAMAKLSDGSYADDDVRDQWTAWQAARASAPQAAPSDRTEALNAAYPLTDSPHTSVVNRAIEARAAFITGWDAKCAAPAAARPTPGFGRPRYLTMVFDMNKPQAASVRELLREVGWERSCWSDAMTERDEARAALAAATGSNKE